MTFIFAPRKSERSILEIRSSLRLAEFKDDDWFIYSNALRNNLMGIRNAHKQKGEDMKVFTEGQPLIIDNGKFFDDLNYLTQHDPKQHNKTK